MARDVFYDIRYDFAGGDWTNNIVKDIEVIKEEDCFSQIVLIRLLVPRGYYVLNPDIGSDLHLLAKRKMSSVTQSEIEKIINDALSPEIDAGNLSDLKIDTEVVDNDKIKVKVDANVIGGNAININLFLGT